jgi:biopolymer transport protein ExbB/TolQ
MAKISIDVEEFKKGLKSQALLAKAQVTEFAKKAQKDFERAHVLKRLEEVIEKVKSQEKVQELMKNPKVQEFAKKVGAASKNASSLLEEVRARVNRATQPKAPGHRTEKIAHKKTKKASGSTASPE